MSDISYREKVNRVKGLIYFLENDMNRVIDQHPSCKDIVFATCETIIAGYCTMIGDKDAQSLSRDARNEVVEEIEMENTVLQAQEILNKKNRKDGKEQ